MNIYSKKALWKRVLIVFALFIVGGSFWYTNEIVNEIAEEERKQVQMWAGAIENKANLVKYTSGLFRELQEEERKKVELWSEATKRIIASAEGGEPGGEFMLALDVVESNTTIPIIMVNENGDITGTRNIPKVIDFTGDTVTAEKAKKYRAYNDSVYQNVLSQMKEGGRRLEVNYYEDKYIYLYYQDSRLFEEIKQTFHDQENLFIRDVLNNSASTPVLFTNQQNDSIVAHANIDKNRIENKELLRATIGKMKEQNEPIVVELGDSKTHYIYYEDSALLRKLKFYPVVQFVAIGLFILIGYWFFSTSRRSEQNRVWVGMSKETAHQLGTPLSSLLAWIELLKAKEVAPETIQEMENDVRRLEVITERFSKIGSAPDLHEENLCAFIKEQINYLKTRVSKKVRFDVLSPQGDVFAKINKPLFGWVIENLSKNAADAMSGNGLLTITVSQNEKKIIIDVTDTGKGIPQGKRKEVFQPGYTSKKRGWGLGLSLTKRIIEIYHKGKIVVHKSELNKGTTFRITLNK